MHPLVALGMAALFSAGAYVSFTFSLWISIPLFFILWYWIAVNSDEIAVLFIAAFAVPIMIGLFVGNVYFYATLDTEATKYVQTTTEVIVPVEPKVQPQKESFSLWKWLNTKPFAEK